SAVPGANVNEAHSSDDGAEVMEVQSCTDSARLSWTVKVADPAGATPDACLPPAVPTPAALNVAPLPPCRRAVSAAGPVTSAESTACTVASRLPPAVVVLPVSDSRTFRTL